jgi:hypothetical protein
MQDIPAQQVALDPDFGQRPRVIVLTAADLRWSSNGGDSWTSLHTWSEETNAVSTLTVLDWSVDPPEVIAGWVSGRVRLLS